MGLLKNGGLAADGRENFEKVSWSSGGHLNSSQTWLNTIYQNKQFCEFKSQGNMQMTKKRYVLCIKM